jgi:hypothetical protein
MPSKAHVRKNARWYVRGYDTTPHEVWGDTSLPALGKGVAKNGDVFPPEATVTAEDSTNAAKLAGLGYVASPTSNWTSGQFMTVGAYRFNWNGTAWVAGAHA